MTADAAHATHRASRFNIRATTDEKRLVERAASFSHMTTTQFVMQAVLRSAEEVLANQTRLIVEPELWDRFVTELDRPARTIPALQQAASRPSPFDES
jgi:uncharacterized protein (DUF1778 family)